MVIVGGSRVGMKVSEEIASCCVFVINVLAFDGIMRKKSESREARKVGLSVSFCWPFHLRFRSFSDNSRFSVSNARMPK
jgi:hypothetical protein